MAADPAQTENRILLLTDAQPNTGTTSTTGLSARLKAAAADSIYMSIVGVGLDFNTDLIDAIARVRGLNWFSVHSPRERTRHWYGG